LLTFTYRDAWAAHYSGSHSEEAWLKRLFTYSDTTDIRHKAKLGYFPSYTMIDTTGKTLSHGQIIHAIRQARQDKVEIGISDPTKRYQIDPGPIPADIFPGVTARDYQLLVAQLALSAGHGIVGMACGLGKTLVFSICAKLLLDRTDVPGLLVLILSKDLLDQTARRFISYGIPADQIGIIHSDIKPQDQHEAATKRVVLSTHLSITKFSGVIDRTRYVFCDEAARAAGPLWSALFPRLPNLTNVLGFTATPWDSETERQRMLAIFGQEICKIPASFGIKRGILMNPEIYFIRLHYPDRDVKLVNAMDWREAQKQYIHEERNRNLLPIAVLRKFGGRMLVLYDNLKHGQALHELYKAQGYETRIAEGKTSTKNRYEAIRWFEKDCESGQQGKVLLASEIFDEGIDIDGGCDLFFNIAAGKDPSKVRQRIGRALRKNRSGRLLCFDVQDANHPTLSRWSGFRREAIRSELGIDPQIITMEEFTKLT
jgi:superfamily II DNA or RNA helicase